MKTRITINLNDFNKAKRFVQTVTRFESNVDIISGHYICDAKSLLAVFSYDLSKPVDVEIISSNEEEITKFNELMKEFE